MKRKNGECAACLKYSVLIFVEKKYKKCNIWRVAVRPSYIKDARFLKVKALNDPRLCPLYTHHIFRSSSEYRPFSWRNFFSLQSYSFLLFLRISFFFFFFIFTGTLFFHLLVSLFFRSRLIEGLVARRRQQLQQVGRHSMLLGQISYRKKRVYWDSTDKREGKWMKRKKTDYIQTII